MKRTKNAFSKKILIILLFFIGNILSAQTKRDISQLSLEELMNVHIVTDVASIFKEDYLKVPSTVSLIKRDDWEKNGYGTMHEIFDNELGIVSYEYFGGHYMSAIRGYGRAYSFVGTATLLDGMPLNSYFSGSSMRIVPNWGLETLNRVEIIKGAGSTLYGSDAFHGVFSMNTFSSNKDLTRLTVSSSTNSFLSLGANFSKGFFDNKLRIDFSFSGTSQGAQNIKYSFDDPAYTIYSPPIENVASQSGIGNRNYKFNNFTSVLHLSYLLSENIKIKTSFYGNSYEADQFAGSYNYLRDRDSMIFSNAPGSYHTREQSVASSKSNFRAGRIDLDYEINNLFSVDVNAYIWQGGFVYSRKPSVSAVNSPIKWDWGYENSRFGSSIILKQKENSFGLQFLTKYIFNELRVLGLTDKAIDKKTGQWKDYNNNLSAAWKKRYINAIEFRLKQSLFNSSVYISANGRIDKYSDLDAQFSPSFSIIYLPTESSSIKLLYSHAFRAPSAEEQTGHFIIKGNYNLKPEIINFYEATYLIQKNNWRFRLNGFTSYWYDGIMFTRIKDRKFWFKEQFQNLGNNHSYGFETDYNYFDKKYSINLGFSYVRSFADDREDKNGVIKNIEYTLYPKYSVIANFKYLIKPIDLYVSLNNKIYLDWTNFDPTTEKNVSELKPFIRTDLIFIKEVKDYRFGLHFRNILNRKNYMPSTIGGIERQDGLEQIGFNIILSGEVKLNY